MAVGMARVWARIASLALAALLALAIGGVVRAHARTVGEIIDDARITAEVMTRLTAESPSNFVKIDGDSAVSRVITSAVMRASSMISPTVRAWARTTPPMASASSAASASEAMRAQTRAIPTAIATT